MKDKGKIPVGYRGRTSANDRYERNGWIGLGITLAVCIILYLVYYHS